MQLTEATMTPTDPNRLRAALIADLEGQVRGRPASEVVARVTNREGVAAEEVRRQLRTLIEQGLIKVGPSLNLILSVRTADRAAAGA